MAEAESEHEKVELEDGRSDGHGAQKSNDEAEPLSLGRAESAAALVDALRKAQSEEDEGDAVSASSELNSLVGFHPKPNGWVQYASKLLFNLGVAPFSRLEEHTVQLLTRRCRVEFPNEGDVIASAGTQPAKLVIVLCGRVEASKASEDHGPGEVVLGHRYLLGEAQPLEQSFLCSSPKTALLVLLPSAYKKALKLRSLKNVSEISAFKELPGNLWRSLLLRLNFVTFDKGDVVFHEGEHGEHLYVMLSGQVSVLIQQQRELLSAIEDDEGAASRNVQHGTHSPNQQQNQEHQQQRQQQQQQQQQKSSASHLAQMERASRMDEVRTLGQGSTFGELALTTDEPRSATVICKDFSEMVTLDRHAYSMLTTALGMASGFGKNFSPEQAEKALEVLSMQPDKRPEKEILSLADGLAAIHFFSKLSFYVRVDLCRGLQHEHYKPNETVFVQGDDGDRLYIIFSGRVELVSRKDTGHAEHLATLSAGSAFGELAILRRAPRSATAITLEECHMASLEADKYDQTLQREHLRTLAKHMDFASRVGMLNGAARSVQLKWAHLMQSVDLARGSTLVQQGEKPEYVYLIRTGECELQYTYKPTTVSNEKMMTLGKQRRRVLCLAVIGAKEDAGICSTVLHQPSSASIVTTTPVKCFFIAAKDFLRALSNKELQKLRERCREREEVFTSRISKAVHTLNDVSSAIARDYQVAMLQQQAGRLHSAYSQPSTSSTASLPPLRRSEMMSPGVESKNVNNSKHERAASHKGAVSSHLGRGPNVSPSMSSSSWPDVGYQGIEIGLSRASSRASSGARSQTPQDALLRGRAPSAPHISRSDSAVQP